MQNITGNYNTIWNSGKYDTEIKLTVYSSDGNNVIRVYSESEIVSLRTNKELYSENHPTIGGAVAGEIDAVFLYGEIEIPRMAMLKPFVRLVGKSGNTVIRSAWVQKGVYWIDTRSIDYETQQMTIHGYDAMLRSESMNTSSSTNSNALLNSIVSYMGVSLDSRNGTLAAITIKNPKTYTRREILQMIAAANAGNWVMTDVGDLRLIGLNDIPAETYYLVTNAGEAITFGGTRILVEGGTT